MKRLIASIAATLALATFAMPTNSEVRKAAPIVKELMDPLVSEFRAKKKSAVEVGDAAMGYAREATTDGAKFLLMKGAIWYFAQAKEDAKAVAAIAALTEQIKDIPPEVIRNDILKPAIDHISAQSVPGLFAQFRSASAQIEVAKLGQLVKRNKADEPERRRYAELLAVTGDWKAALEVFAKLRDAKAVQAAREEIAGKTLAPAGDFWWDYKPSVDMAAEAAKIHAVTLYRRAIASGELTGLRKVIAEKRIAEVEATAGANAAKMAAGPVSGGNSNWESRRLGGDKLYCVVDLSAGPTASNYPVSYLAAEPKGGWTDEYKTTKLVLRRIKPGSFIMGDDQTNESNRVTLTKPFYIGVFEVTQKQYELVTGDNPSAHKGDMRPVEKVSYDMVRGSSEGGRWPASSAVDADSFMGKFRARTGLEFDLPTEAQWEYACRAGTTTHYNNGQNFSQSNRNEHIANAAMALVGRYRASQSDGKGGYSQHTVVGCYQPNIWGLYDMHGNVAEWCLDRCFNERGSLPKGTNPVGPSSGLNRIIRGGSWDNYAFVCSNANRWSLNPSVNQEKSCNTRGFRLALPLTDK